MTPYDHPPAEQTPPGQQPPNDKGPLSWGRIGLAVLIVVGVPAVLGSIVLSILYAMSYFDLVGYTWPVVLVDGFWRWFDGSIERLKLFASLLPLLVVFVAYLVYRSDQWWKRAEWALDAATADLTEAEAAQERNRRTLGLEAMHELANKRMAPPKDEALFSVLTEHAVSIETERLARKARAKSAARHPSNTARGAAARTPAPRHGRKSVLRRILEKRTSKGGGGSCR